MEGPGIVNERMVQNWFRRSRVGDTSLENEPKLERPSIVEDEALLEMVETQAPVYCQQNLVL